jgi:hypothetical protein
MTSGDAGQIFLYRVPETNPSYRYPILRQRVTPVFFTAYPVPDNGTPIACK